MSFSVIMSLIVTAFCVVLIAVAAISFFRWRPSAFDTVTGYLKTARHIPKDEAVDIYLTNGARIKGGKHHKPLIYFKYVYRVNSAEYCIEHVCDDDEPSTPMPTKVKIHYHRNYPGRAYRDGAVKMGYAGGITLLILAVLLLIPSLLVLLEYFSILP